MGGPFAGTGLSPSAVHALIELGTGQLTARELGERLRLEKSSVSRMLRKLVDEGYVAQGAADTDGRTKPLSLTKPGRTALRAIDAFARAQVEDALRGFPQDQQQGIVQGLQRYSRGLRGESPASAALAAVGVSCGYRPALIAKVTELHARYYAREAGFGQPFESVVAAGLADFCGRLHNPRNQIWTAVVDGEVAGAIAIDGEDLGGNLAHLRWFILADAFHGRGIGKRLLDAALAFVDAHAFAGTHLWTFAGLDAARHLYESRGFVLDAQRMGDQWGKAVLEQCFVRPGQR
ncbi:bifunctional helix-turn-helix transcriptional regulator/GNAT family N-acetyltransferase [Stenotrophomonas sp. 24(2023)]|uniref:bifunctional helix-turn-helix transcriptional regulator/GNAT family N-acetyltransferase n=1 Tax=Stenotrophomonas sp. 24(2023) TaxID=3068324 RepID=UPI0027E03ECB|nr:bifunctional helix-turn-helix transcriptional regulator/GNAT family N-acetyltransferase [Stenotrophomonas sp. 24(2023)]WMJ69214.1 bifunctional helix-turn-helix transcriptional regulator/GNAT family N-acetyltransferase [Stenotrophomonas sp. 24(2023)]